MVIMKNAKRSLSFCFYSLLYSLSLFKDRLQISRLILGEFKQAN